MCTECILFTDDEVILGLIERYDKALEFDAHVGAAGAEEGASLAGTVNLSSRGGSIDADPEIAYFRSLERPRTAGDGDEEPSPPGPTPINFQAQANFGADGRPLTGRRYQAAEVANAPPRPGASSIKPADKKLAKPKKGPLRTKDLSKKRNQANAAKRAGAGDPGLAVNGVAVFRPATAPLRKNRGDSPPLLCHDLTLWLGPPWSTRDPAAPSEKADGAIEVGLAGIMVLDSEGSAVEVLPDHLSIILRSSPRSTSFQVLQDVNTRALVDGMNNTTLSHHQWLLRLGAHIKPFQVGIRISVAKAYHREKSERRGLPKVAISGLRIWNFNESAEESFKGVRELRIDADGRVIPPFDEAAVGPTGGYHVRKAPGTDGFDFSQFLLLTEGAVAGTTTTDIWQSSDEAKAAEGSPKAESPKAEHHPRGEPLGSLSRGLTGRSSPTPPIDTPFGSGAVYYELMSSRAKPQPEKGATAGPIKPLRLAPEQLQEIKGVDLHPLTCMVQQQYETPLYPRGSTFKFVLKGTWGDSHYIGLNGLELYDETGSKVRSRWALLQRGLVNICCSRLFIRLFSTTPMCKPSHGISMYFGHQMTCRRLIFAL